MKWNQKKNIYNKQPQTMCNYDYIAYFQLPFIRHGIMFFRVCSFSGLLWYFFVLHLSGDIIFKKIKLRAITVC